MLQLPLRRFSSLHRQCQPAPPPPSQQASPPQVRLSRNLAMFLELLGAMLLFLAFIFMIHMAFAAVAIITIWVIFIGLFTVWVQEVLMLLIFLPFIHFVYKRITECQIHWCPLCRLDCIIWQCATRVWRVFEQAIIVHFMAIVFVLYKPLGVLHFLGQVLFEIFSLMRTAVQAHTLTPMQQVASLMVLLCTGFMVLNVVMGLTGGTFEYGFILDSPRVQLLLAVVSVSLLLYRPRQASDQEPVGSPVIDRRQQAEPSQPTKHRSSPYPRRISTRNVPRTEAKRQLAYRWETSSAARSERIPLRRSR